MNQIAPAPLAPPPSTPYYLHKIQSIKKQLEIFDILQAIHPTHAERLWLTGFLKYTGYNYEETCKIIHDHCQWEDYSQTITRYQVSTIYKQPHSFSTSKENIKPRVRKWQLTPTEEYRIKLARSAESHRELQRWAKANGVAIYDAAPGLPFDAAKMGGQEK